MELVAFIALVAAVVWWIGGPLRHGAAKARPDLGPLELEHELRLIALRDAELDAQVGKITPERHRELDAELRGEALATLRELATRRRDIERGG